MKYCMKHRAKHCMNGKLVLVLLLALFFLPFCGEEAVDETVDNGDDSSYVGTGETYEYDDSDPLLGVYKGDTPMMGMDAHSTYWEFAADGTCYSYYVALNLVMVGSYNFYESSNTILMGETSKYTTFGNETEITHPMMPLSNIPPFTNVGADSSGMTLHMGDTNEYSLTRLSTAFPGSPQEASTKVVITVDVSELAGKTLLAMTMIGGDEPTGGVGINVADGSGQGTVSLYVPDSVFQAVQATNGTIMVGDIDPNDYMMGKDGLPFDTYVGIVNWDGNMEEEQDPVSISKGVENSYSLSNVTFASNLK